MMTRTLQGTITVCMMRDSRLRSISAARRRVAISADATRCDATRRTHSRARHAVVDDESVSRVVMNAPAAAHHNRSRIQAAREYAKQQKVARKLARALLIAAAEHAEDAAGRIGQLRRKR
eukprot:6210611-Pleurochrysis_carterae.AAC.1